VLGIVHGQEGVGGDDDDLGEVLHEHALGDREVLLVAGDQLAVLVLGQGPEAGASGSGGTKVDS